MIPVEARYDAGRLGDCLVACIASVAEVPYDQVPHFAEHGPGWWDAWRAWSQAELGVDVAAMLPPAAGTLDGLVDGDPAAVVAIAAGPSPRSPQIRHAVVVDGNLRILHDPHPSRAGLPSIDELYLFVPIRHPPESTPA